MLQSERFEISEKELAQHCTKTSAFVSLDGKVYDITEFLESHPGGEDILMEYAGTDISEAMRDPAFNAHSEYAFKLLDDFYIGHLSTPNNSSEKPNLQEIKEDVNFLDLKKPLLSQMWNGNMTKEFYLQQVHVPRHLPHSAKIFGNPILELLTKTPWYVIPLIWVPFSGYIFYKGVQVYSFSYALPMMLFGILLWTLMEYAIHRYLFHVEQYLPDNQIAFTGHFLLHGVHHFLPMDRYRLVMPPALATIIAIPLWLTFQSLIGMNLTMTVGSGTFLGYVMYDLTHYYLHHGRSMLSHFKIMKTYHMNHHYKESNLGFGITSKIWDYAFNTVLPE